MDTVRFEVERIDTPAWGSIDSAVIFVNDRNLVDLAREVELPFASRENKPHLAGDYIGLPAGAIFSPSRRLLGEPEERYDDWGDKISILGCGCGVVGCWPLWVGISARDEVVVWNDFEQPHRRGWDHGGLGPFVFDRAGYEAALRERPDGRRTV